MLNKIIPPVIKNYIRKKSGVPDIFLSLERLQVLGFRPRQIVDVGAYHGEWTRKCARIFPEAEILMVEAMERKSDALNKIVSNNDKISAEIRLLGARSGDEVYFSEIETASSVLEEVCSVHTRTTRTTITLDDVLRQRHIQKVDLLKLDVQGYELEVLKGFSRYIGNTEVILTEVSLLDIHKNVPLMKDVVNFMFEWGFVVYDICSVSTRRPLDNALWQTDLMFVKENSSFRSDKHYQK